jgi:hypothetical protein
LPTIYHGTCNFLSRNHNSSKEFKIQSVDDKVTPGPAGRKHALDAAAVTAPSLGVLSNFTGSRVGIGFNAIWRPSSGTRIFENDVPLINRSRTPVPKKPNESISQLNLTTDELAFSKTLGHVPNRGLGSQRDVTLSGVSYIQVLRDVTNINTGKADGAPQEIHFEPGLCMHVEATVNDGDTLSRMASIPHGTTVNALDSAWRPLHPPLQGAARR